MVQYTAVCSRAGRHARRENLFFPHWLYREMQLRGPGDYLVATPTFPLLELKALPEFRRLFEDLLAMGRYIGSPTRSFTLSESGQRRLFKNAGRSLATRVLFGYAAEPESLESATIKAACLDEAGQKRFKLGAWEAILRRLSIHQGRALITTTIYNLGWLKQQVYDRWLAGDFDMAVALNGGRTDPYPMYNRYFTKDGNLVKVSNFTDDEIDSLWDSIFRESLTHMMEDPRNIGVGIHYILVARYLERIADHSCNIGDRVVFMVTGERMDPYAKKHHGETRPVRRSDDHDLVPTEGYYSTHLSEK